MIGVWGEVLPVSLHALICEMGAVTPVLPSEHRGDEELRVALGEQEVGTL